jgi:ribonuclease D
MANPTIKLHRYDLPESVRFSGSVAIDTETMGLQPHRDRLCLVQLSAGDGTAHLVQFPEPRFDAPNLKAMLADRSILKLFHFARFDVAVLKHALGVTVAPVYCTKIASRLKDLVKDLCDIDLSKQQQSSDWGAPDLTPEQMRYAASDVLHLHAMKVKLDAMLAREGRTELAQACFDFLPHRAQLDLAGWPELDIFAH